MKKNILNVILGILIVMVIIVLVFLGVLLYNKLVLKNTYDINLLGLDDVSIYAGEIYNDAGYIAKDYKGNDATSLVKVDGSVNVNAVGKYEIIYSINNFFKKNEVKRIVNVLEDPLKNVNFSLNGANSITLNLNNEYSELGFICLDKNNSDCSDYVTINSNVLVNKIGIYNVDYILKIGGKEKKLTRSVQVIGSNYEYNLSTTKLVNTDVVITFRSNINNLDYIVKPDGDKDKSELVKYSASLNGQYKFVVYDTNGVSTEVIVAITNIDKEAPVGTCNAFVDSNSTTYTISASDNIKIVKYVHEKYPNNAYTSNSFKINDRIGDGKILIYDEASNYTKVDCNTKYEYLGVTGNDKVYEYNSSSLKYWIERPSSSYYISHIWMNDPYNQLKTALPSSFGTLSTAKTILNNEISLKGYSRKGMVIVNGSAFTSSDFDRGYWAKIPEWKNMAITPVIINDGKIIRDFTNRELPNNQYFTYGLTKKGKLKYYTFENISDIETNQKTRATMVSDGVKYTFGFRPVLIWEGKKAYSNSTTSNYRQTIGQIDNNNFIILTTTTKTSLDYVTGKLLTLGCHTAFNIDGGGSINLFYKGQNSGITTLKSSSRKIVDILYFVER